MFVSGSESLGNSVPVYCSGSTSFDVRSWKISLKNFQGLLSIVQLSMFFFVVVISCDSFYIISKCFMFVNNFFKLFFIAHLLLSATTSIYYHVYFTLSTHFLRFFIFIFQGTILHPLLQIKIHHFSVTDFYNTIISFYCQAFYLNIVAIFIIILLSYKKLRIWSSLIIPIACFPIVVVYRSVITINRIPTIINEIVDPTRTPASRSWKQKFQSRCR